MLLLFVSFSLSLGVYFLFQELGYLAEVATKSHRTHTNTSYANCYLEAVNHDISKSLAWLSTFFRVYLIGVVETIYITLNKRGLFKNSTTRVANEAQVDTIVSSNANYDGQIAVITGGDSGIGLEITKGLLKAGFHVIMGIHSATTNTDELLKSTGSDKINCVPLDLTSFKSVHQFVNNVQKLVPKKNIQLLINNAGIMNVPFKLTEDGFEIQSQTNFLSPILLTRSLLSYMNQKTGRVLFASSSTLYTVNNLDLNTPVREYGLNGLEHYANSKACIAQLAQRLTTTTPVKIYTYHPGTVRTKLFSTTAVFNLPVVSGIFDYIMLSPKEGSATPIYLCLSKELGDNGSYYANGYQQSLPSVYINSKENNVEELWIDTMKKIELNESE